MQGKECGSCVHEVELIQKSEFLNPSLKYPFYKQTLKQAVSSLNSREDTMGMQHSPLKAKCSLRFPCATLQFYVNFHFISQHGHG